VNRERVPNRQREGSLRAFQEQSGGKVELVEGSWRSREPRKRKLDEEEVRRRREEVIERESEIRIRIEA